MSKSLREKVLTRSRQSKDQEDAGYKGDENIQRLQRNDSIEIDHLDSVLPEIPKQQSLEIDNQGIKQAAESEAVAKIF